MSHRAYIRVSSKAQDHKTQRDAIMRARPDMDVWYAERMSAKTNDRPELLRLLADVRMGSVSDLWCFKLDRLCRTGVADTFAIVRELRQAGVTLHAVADNLVIRPGSDDIASECYVFALGLAARLERAGINDRIAAARVRMEATGEPWGRPRRMGKDDVARARAMRGQGRSVSAIAIALKFPRATIGRAVVGVVPSQNDAAGVPAGSL